MTQIYCDIADINTIKKFSKKKIVKGFTTNPSLMRRAGDVGKDPIPEIKKSIKIAKNFKNVKILWASVREPYNYLQASQLGCHIITVPPNIISKIENFGKSFKSLTRDTVKTFLVDSRKSNFSI